MARYFFNIRSGGDYVVDDDGDDCPSLQAAGTRAVDGARVLLQELHDSRRAPRVTAFEITDQRGRLCLRIPFTLAQRSPANADAGKAR
jgi:hypothetical protein